MAPNNKKTNENISSGENKKSDQIDSGRNKVVWGHLITQTPLRFKIWTILSLYGSLNVTQISNNVKAGKSTVSKYLREMEEDKLICSETIESEIEGRYPQKLYRLEEIQCQIDEKEEETKVKNEDEIEISCIPQNTPENAEERIQYYKDDIKMYRASVEWIKMVLDLMDPLLNKFEKTTEIATDELIKSKSLINEEKNNLLPVTEADDLFTKYFQGELEPRFSLSHVDGERLRLREKAFKEGNKVIEKELIDYTKRARKEGRSFCNYSLILPLKALLELNSKNGKN